MRDLLLILHFLGLAMGLGTSFAFMFLGMASAKMSEEEAKKFRMQTMSLSRMGHIGLALLLLSGFGLIGQYLDNIADMPLFIAQLVLAALLILIISLMTMEAKKAMATGDDVHFNKIANMGKISLLTALGTMILAVLSFH